MSSTGFCSTENTAISGSDLYICLTREDDTYKTYTSADGSTWTEKFSDSLQGITATYYVGLSFSDGDVGSGGISVSLNNVQVQTISATCPNF